MHKNESLQIEFTIIIIQIKIKGSVFKSENQNRNYF